jgi:hypothetical protein
MCHNLDLRFLPFIAFYQKNSLPLFRFFDLAFYCLFSFFLFGFFIVLCFHLIFRSCFVPRKKGVEKRSLPRVEELSEGFARHLGA